MKYGARGRARYFRDHYGSTASIVEGEGERPFRLRISAYDGRRWCDRSYGTYRGARVALGRMGDCWEEVTA